MADRQQALANGQLGLAIPAGVPAIARYAIFSPEIARATTSRWISDVPSKIV